MPELRKTLIDRNRIYGDYGAAADAREIIMNEFNKLHDFHHDSELSNIDFMSILDIVNKLLRLAVTPSHEDSWHDIAGYATLIKNFYKERKNAN